MGIRERLHFSDVVFAELGLSGGWINGLNATVVTNGAGCLWMLFSHQSGHVLTIHGTHEGWYSSFTLKSFNWAIMMECEFIFIFNLETRAYGQHLS